MDLFVPHSCPSVGAGAFEQQFQRLMSSEMLDMDAEIKLLEKMRKMEGIT